MHLKNGSIILFLIELMTSLLHYVKIIQLCILQILYLYTLHMDLYKARMIILVHIFIFFKFYLMSNWGQK